jgi:hypothetical protein
MIIGLGTLFLENGKSFQPLCIRTDTPPILNGAQPLPTARADVAAHTALTPAVPPALESLQSVPIVTEAGGLQLAVSS